MAEGTARVGTQYQALFDTARLNEFKFDALGFGLPVLAVNAINAVSHGTVDLTTAAASLTGTAVETFSATSAITTTASSLSGTVTQTFSATGALTGAASSLVSTGTSSVSGEGAVTSAASVLDSTGSLGYNGVVALDTSASSVSATGTSARRRQGGHNIVDLAGYTKFVNRGNTILEDLGQPPAGTGATTPVVDPVPSIKIPSPDYREVLAKSIDRVTLKPLVVPPLKVTGKRWNQGHVAQTTDPIWLSVSGTNQFEFDFSLESAPSSLTATGTVDIYYNQRRQEDDMIKEFIVNELYGARVA